MQREINCKKPDSHHGSKCNTWLGIWASLREAEGIITSYCNSHKAVPAKLSLSSHTPMCAQCRVSVLPVRDPVRKEIAHTSLSCNL